MAEPTVDVVQDRLYAINQLIDADLAASRYYPTSTDRLPLITSIPSRASHNVTTYGTENMLTSRDYLLLMWVENFMAGVPTVTAQRKAETLMDKVIETYWSRPRLELAEVNAAGVTVFKPLDGVMEDVRITLDSGIVAEKDNPKIATVRFTLAVETARIIRRAGNDT